jgi:hypothetical protein
MTSVKYQMTNGKWKAPGTGEETPLVSSFPWRLPNSTLYAVVIRHWSPVIGQKRP